MSKQETLEEDVFRSELIFKQHLKALREALGQQSLETEWRHREELQRRINENALLSTDQDSSIKQEVNRRAKHMEMRRSTSISALTSDKETSHHLRQPERLNTQFPTNQKGYSTKTSMLIPTRAPQCERLSSTKTTQMKKEDEDEAECQRKFCARPVPRHVTQPHYQEMMEQREKERKQAHEQRREFLLSAQKPFDFLERERAKKEAVVKSNQVSRGPKNKAGTICKPSQNEVKDSSVAGLKSQGAHSHGPTQKTVRHKNPAASGCLKLRTAERTRKEKLAFLYERPSFQPQIIHQVPDFRKLHLALQTEALRKAQTKDEIKCQPFNLRTSALPARRYRRESENIQEPKISNRSRSKSLGNLTSLSTDILPLYITDTLRKRCLAIRKSIDIRESNNQESADWLRKNQTRSQAMRKTITLHAKSLDPHSSLKEVHDEKLQRHRMADQRRMRDYTRDLRDMKARVGERPYLFEQVKQRNAKAHAEQVYRDKLKEAGIDEQFVEENGAAGSTSTSSGSEDDAEESDIRRREENVDDREKIEDVDWKSVKSKGEEMP